MSARSNRELLIEWVSADGRLRGTVRVPVDRLPGNAQTPAYTRFNRFVVLQKLTNRWSDARVVEDTAWPTGEAAE